MAQAMKTEQRLVERLSRETLALAIERIKEEAEVTAKSACGIFPFKDSERNKGMVSFFGAFFDESFRALGWEISDGRCIPPKDTMVMRLYSDYQETRHYYLYKSGYEEQSPEYILFFDGKILRTIDFEHIEAAHQKAIKDTMAKWALRSIKQDLVSLEYEECEGA